MKVNRGDFEEAAEEFKKWTKAGGKVLPGLVKRRNDERVLFLS
jgi:GH24 family phage-related lysozyme (muramidase)